MRKIILVGIALGMLCNVGCTRHMAESKACGPTTARENGFEVIGYQGYNISLIYGAMAWYTMRKIPDNGITYEAAFAPWYGECQMYNEKALDAIKP